MEKLGLKSGQRGVGVLGPGRKKSSMGSWPGCSTDWLEEGPQFGRSVDWLAKQMIKAKEE